MAKSRRGGQRSAQTPPPVTPTPTTSPAPTPRTRLTPQQISNLKPTPLTDTEAQENRDDVEDMYTPDVVDAIKQYISNTDAGNGFSKAQWLNYRLENNLPLNTNEKFMDRYMQEGMHGMPKDTTVYRAAHDDVLQRLGVNNYDKYSEAQLQQMLNGKSWTADAYVSTSYDKSKNPFMTGAQSGGREIYMNIKTPSGTPMLYGAKAQSEIILNKGTNFQVVSVHYDNTYATPRNGRMKRRLIMDVVAY